MCLQRLNKHQNCLEPESSDSDEDGRGSEEEKIAAAGKPRKPTEKEANTSARIVTGTSANTLEEKKRREAKEKKKADKEAKLSALILPFQPVCTAVHQLPSGEVEIGSRSEQPRPTLGLF